MVVGASVVTGASVVVGTSEVVASVGADVVGAVVSGAAVDEVVEASKPVMLSSFS